MRQGATLAACVTPVRAPPAKRRADGRVPPVAAPRAGRDRGRAGQGHAYPGYADGGYAGPGSADAGYSDRGYADAGYDEPGYSALAVSDPAADVTSTQTWGAVDDSPATSGWDSAATGGWSDLSGPRTGPRRAALPHTDPHQLPLPRTESGRE